MSTLHNVDDRFWAKVKQLGPDDCWPWIGAIKSNGYGHFNVSGHTILAHRYAFVAARQNPIPAGLLVCHHCDNRLCCNPAHLFLGTNQDNLQDMQDKGRKNQVRGEACGRTKLSTIDIESIKNLAFSGLSTRAIAKIYNIAPSQAWRIVNGQSWRHLCE